MLSCLLEAIPTECDQTEEGILERLTDLYDAIDSATIEKVHTEKRRVAAHPWLKNNKEYQLVHDACTHLHSIDIFSEHLTAIKRAAKQSIYGLRTTTP